MLQNLRQLEDIVDNKYVPLISSRIISLILGASEYDYPFEEIKRGMHSIFSSPKLETIEKVISQVESLEDLYFSYLTSEIPAILTKYNIGNGNPISEEYIQVMEKRAEERFSECSDLFEELGDELRLKFRGKVTDIEGMVRLEIDNAKDMIKTKVASEFLPWETMFELLFSLKGIKYGLIVLDRIKDVIYNSPKAAQYFIIDLQEFIERSSHPFFKDEKIIFDYFMYSGNILIEPIKIIESVYENYWELEGSWLDILKLFEGDRFGKIESIAGNIKRIKKEYEQESTEIRYEKTVRLFLQGVPKDKRLDAFGVLNRELIEIFEVSRGSSGPAQFLEFFENYSKLRVSGIPLSRHLYLLKNKEQKKFLLENPELILSDQNSEKALDALYHLNSQIILGDYFLYQAHGQLNKARLALDLAFFDIEAKELKGIRHALRNADENKLDGFEIGNRNTLVARLSKISDSFKELTVRKKYSDTLYAIFQDRQDVIDAYNFYDNIPDLAEIYKARFRKAVNTLKETNTVFERFIEDMKALKGTQVIRQILQDSRLFNKYIESLPGGCMHKEFIKFENSKNPYQGLVSLLFKDENEALLMEATQNAETLPKNYLDRRSIAVVGGKYRGRYQQIKELMDSHLPEDHNGIQLDFYETRIIEKRPAVLSGYDLVLISSSYISHTATIAAKKFARSKGIEFRSFSNNGNNIVELITGIKIK